MDKRQDQSHSNTSLVEHQKATQLTSAEIRFALRRWHDDAELSRCPLAQRLEINPNATLVHIAEEVRRMLRHALDALKPTPRAVPPRPDESAWDDPAWQNYLVLTVPYGIDSQAEQMGAAAVAHMFRVSLPTLYRRQEDGIVQVAHHVSQYSMDVEEASHSPKLLSYNHLTTPPAPTKHFVAREDIVQRLAAQFEQSSKGWMDNPDTLSITRDAYIFVIHGLPGMGKTALLAELAHRQSVTKTFSATMWLSLGAGADDDLLPRLRAWAMTLGMSESEVRLLSSERECEIAIAKKIGTAQLLILFDDVCTRKDAESCLAALGTNCSVVMTTRYPRLATELGLSDENVIGLNELDAAQSLSMLKAYAPDAVRKFPELAEQLTAQLNGWPIALRLAGEQLRRAAGSGQIRRMKQAFESLIASLPNSEPLGAMIAASNHSAEAQALLQRLSTLSPKPVTFSEAFALGLSQTSECDTLVTLDELVDVGLVERVSQPKRLSDGMSDVSHADRYTVHPVIVDHARSKVDANDDDTWLQMALFVQAQAETAAADYITLDQIMDHVRHALSVAHERGYHEVYAQIVTTITPYLLTRSQTDWLGRIATQALACAEAAQNRLLIAAHHLTLGQLAARANDDVGAKQHLDDALHYADGDDVALVSLRATIYETQANVALQRKDKAEAARLLVLAMRAAQAAKKNSVVPRLMMQLDQLTSVTEPQAQTEATAAMHLWVQGGREFVTGNVAHAEHLLMQSVEIARRIQACKQLVTSLGLLATVAAMNANAALVKVCADEGMPLADDIVYPRTLSWLYASPALICVWRGDVDGANRWIAKGFEEAARLGLTDSTSWLWYVRSLIGLHTSNLTLAYSAAHEAVALGRKAEHVDELANPLAVLGYLAAKRGEFKEAQVIFADALALCQPLESNIAQQIMVRAMQGEALYLEGRYEDALGALLPISEMGCSIAPNYFPLLRTEWTLAKIYAAQGHNDKAMKQGREAERRYVTAGNVGASDVAAWLQRLS